MNEFLRGWNIVSIDDEGFLFGDFVKKNAGVNILGVVVIIVQTVKASVGWLMINLMKVIIGGIIIGLLENVL